VGFLTNKLLFCQNSQLQLIQASKLCFSQVGLQFSCRSRAVDIPHNFVIILGCKLWFDILLTLFIFTQWFRFDFVGDIFSAELQGCLRIAESGFKETWPSGFFSFCIQHNFYLVIFIFWLKLKKWLRMLILYFNIWYSVSKVFIYGYFLGI
jgi:hypothetical protein